MRETIDVFDYAGTILKQLPKGALLNTNGNKFNTMIIGWAHIGIMWGEPTLHVYVREHRYTKSQLDITDDFTVSVPLENANPEILKVCGTQSGRDIDKAEAAHLTLEDAESVKTPVIREYPLTIECKKLYAQPQILEQIPEEIRTKMYPQDVDSSYYRANRDAHTMYVGKIVNAYIIR